MSETDAFFAWETYVPSGGEQLFTMILQPDREGKYPTVLMRMPYVTPGDHAPMMEQFRKGWEYYAKRGYAVVYQHCRGCGESTGDFLPFENEREDGLALQEWVRRQSFYNGELFIVGVSYTSALEYATMPFAPDVKAASLDVMAPGMYHWTFRNGFLKLGLMGDWYVSMYKQKSLTKHYPSRRSWELLPLTDFAEQIIGEKVPALDELLHAVRPEDPFWNTPQGGSDTLRGVRDVRIPLLMGTGHVDIFVGAMLDFWRQMTEEDRARCALVIAASDHADVNSPKDFPCRNGRRSEHFPAGYVADWFDAARGLKPFPVEQGKVTSFCSFADEWETDGFERGAEERRLPVGGGEFAYLYNPFDAPEMPGGLTSGFGGAAMQPKAGWRADVATRYTEPFAEGTYIRGPFELRLTVSSDCEDTAFYFRVSIETEQGDLALRDDITSLRRQVPDYVPGQKARVVLRTDDHSLFIAKGQRLRLDVASANRNVFLRHTNTAEPFADAASARCAHNILYLDESEFVIYARPEKGKTNA